MSADTPLILCVGFDAQTETRITTEFEKRDAAVDLSTTPERAEAIDRLEAASGSVDCVISSNSLADASGIDLIRTVRDSFPDLPYILFVEELSNELINEAIDAGVTEYLPQTGGDPQVRRLADRALEVAARFQDTRRTAELERINTVVRDLNRELVHAETSNEIDRRVCEIISESEPYLFAWIGEHDPETRTVTGRAAAGVKEGYLDAIEITTDGKPTAQGPTGKAVRTHEMQVMQNIPGDPSYDPWRKDALERGYRSSAAVPFVYEGTLYGVLNVYADRTNAFDTEEQAVLEELGTTIAYAHHDMEIREEARRFRRAVEQAADAIFITDTAGTIEYVNPAFEELTGYAASEVVGRTPRILQSGEQTNEYYESMWETILQGDIRQSEIIDEDRSGERYYAEQTIAPLRDESGTVEGFVTIQHDITERKKHERQLKRSKERLRLLFDKAPDGIVVHDVEGEIFDVNETLIKNLGYTREELLSMTIFDFEIGIDEALVRNEWESIDRETIHKVEVEGIHQRKDGSTYPCEVWVSRVTSEHRERDRFIALTRDITDRKQRERKQRETQQLLELAMETADAGVWEWDIQSETIFWEDSMERLLGLEPGTFDGTYEAFIERVHPEDRLPVEQTIERALRQQTGFEEEFRLRRESDDFVWFLTRTRLFTDVENTPKRMVGVGIDISERIDQTRQLQVLDRVLRHNLRNDMSIIEGFARTIRDDVDGVTDETDIIIETSRQLMKTVEKQREIVELLAKRPTRERFDITDVCQQIVTDMREEYPGVAIEIDRPETAAVIATSKIERAIEELTENAIVHNETEPPEVSIAVESRDETVRIKIADNGPRIPAEEVNVLTHEYEVEPLYHGSGLGLWLVNWIVRLSEGTLVFEENDPRGNSITIELEKPT